MSTESKGILILDFGSQFTQLIARRIREAHVYCRIERPDRGVDWIREQGVEGIVLSGGPSSVYDDGAPVLDPDLLEIGVPIFGICYGMQLIAHHGGGEVKASGEREYGRAPVTVTSPIGVFAGFNEGETVEVWMSHGDHITALPPGFETIGSSTNAPIAGFADTAKHVYGVQFHPEVVHTSRGTEMIHNFLFDICGCEPDWTPGHFIHDQIEAVHTKVGNEKRAICGLSGGVDSAVAAALVHRALGERLTCIFVDHGLLRENERDQVEHTFRRELGVELIVVDARNRFLTALKEIDDPEEKRRIIGHTFIDVFEEAANEVDGDVGFLVQGTLYPDVIESSAPHGGPSVTIKTHHNVGGLRPDLPFELIEPLRELFKDEVRSVGRELGLTEEIVGRHPFPGPGLAIRILGDVNEESLEILRRADAIYIDEIRKAGLYDQIWQAFAVLLPIKTVGVMGDSRTYENVVALRAVTSKDGMTADWFPFPNEVIGRISNRIINEVKGVNRVVYDVSSKPPATIEWE